MPGSLKRVLVVPGTTEIGLEILRSLSRVKGLQVVGAGTDVELGRDSGFDQYEYLPNVDDPAHLDKLGELCARSEVDFVYPAHDSECHTLRSTSEIGGAALVSHPAETVHICRSKHRTYAVLAGQGVAPRVYRHVDEITDYPIFVKPAVGQGSVGAVRVGDRAELVRLVQRQGAGSADFFDSFVVSEFLPGCEVTVDCFSDFGRVLKYSAARTRSAVSRGISIDTREVHIPELTRMAEQINESIAMSGAWFFQAIQDETGSYRVTEVACRIAGTSGLRRAQGVNLPHLSLLNAMGLEVEVLDQPHAIRSRRHLSERFFSDFRFRRVYVDLDDTLELNGRLDSELVGFLFGVRAGGREVNLLTRHRGDLHLRLVEMGIQGLFNEVVHVVDGSPKSQSVDDSEGALVIDDSFRELRDCSRLGNTLALDSSALPGLWGLISNDYA